MTVVVSKNELSSGSHLQNAGSHQRRNHVIEDDVCEFVVALLNTNMFKTKTARTTPITAPTIGLRIQNALVTTTQLPMANPSLQRKKDILINFFV